MEKIVMKIIKILKKGSKYNYKCYTNKKRKKIIEKTIQKCSI